MCHIIHCTLNEMHYERIISSTDIKKHGKNGTPFIFHPRVYKSIVRLVNAFKYKQISKSFIIHMFLSKMC